MIIPSCLLKKDYVYFNDKSHVTSTSHTVQNMEYLISFQDILYVTLKTLDYVSWFGGVNRGENVNTLAEPLFYFRGYIINDKGNIVLPGIGSVFVLGKTLKDITIDIQKKVDVLYKGSIVDVRTAGVKVSVFGEVNKPGKYTFFQSKVSVFNALSISGGLTDHGNMRRVKLLRYTDDIVEVHMLDLTKQSFLTSEFYFLQPNDVLYIESRKIDGRNLLVVFRDVLALVSSSVLILTYIKS